MLIWFGFPAGHPRKLVSEGEVEVCPARRDQLFAYVIGQGGISFSLDVIGHKGTEGRSMSLD